MGLVPVHTPTKSRFNFTFIRPGSPETPLHHYRWRSVTTLLGPLVILGFYVFISVYFLRRPPVNNIVLSLKVDANWIFYSWFITSVLIIDWARTGLANIEACALMNPRYAPSTIDGLMWHADSKWSSPIWWIKALSAYVVRLIQYRLSSLKSRRHVPGGLWVLLAIATAAVHIAIPLSGLSFQTVKVWVVSDDLADIYGPGQTSFGVNTGSRRKSISYAWRTGHQTKLRDGILFYAPSTSKRRISQTYFDDMVGHQGRYIETFVGPAVRENVYGRAWGLWSNLSCNPVAANELRMIRTNRYDNVSIKLCQNSTSGGCHFQWTDVAKPEHQPASAGTSLPVWLYKTGVQENDLVRYSTIAAADGFNRASEQNLSTLNRVSPYFSSDQHDNMTFAHFSNATETGITTAMMEVYFWETRATSDRLIQKWSKKTPYPISIVHESKTYINRSAGGNDIVWAGFGLHCDVTSAVGFAYLDPSRRQFSHFEPSAALESSNRNQSGARSATVPKPIQIQAMATMFGQDGLPTNEESQSHRTEPDSFLWLAIQDSIGVKPSRIVHKKKGTQAVSHRLALLEPEGLQNSMYKLLGQSMVVLMKDTGMDPWKGELRTLRKATYIVAGPVPWQYVMALLLFWASVTSGGALWMLMAGPRWAPTLDGSEMFKLGAQYGDEVDGSARVGFETHQLY